MATGYHTGINDAEIRIELKPKFVAIAHGGTIKLIGEFLPSGEERGVNWFKDSKEGPELIDTKQIKYAGSKDYELVINRVTEEDGCQYFMEVSYINGKKNRSSKSIIHLFGHKHTNVLTTQENNFVRFFLLVKLSEDALKILFNKLVPPSTLKSHLDKNKKKLSGKCSDVQKKILFPEIRRCPVSSEDFDSSLIYILIRNTCKDIIKDPKNGWGKDPHKKSYRISDDVERIRRMRNHTFHAQGLSLKEFNDTWNDLAEAIHRISNGTLDCEVEKLKFKHLDIGIDLVRGFQDLDQPEIEEWKEKDKIFVKTRAYNEIMKRICTKKCVTIIGGPGAGKLTIARHCALMLQEEGWKIISISFLNQIRQKYYNLVFDNHFQGVVYVIQNPIGKHKLELDGCEILKREECFFEGILNDSESKVKVRIICTSRRSIQKEAECLNLSIFRDSYVVDLESREFTLDCDEMQRMFKHHCSMKQVDLQISNLTFSFSDLHVNPLPLREKQKSAKKVKGIPPKISANEDCRMFPLLCRLFTSDTTFQNHGINFFKQPCYCLMEQLKEMYIFEKEKYCALVLCMLGGNAVTNETYENQELLTDVFNVCGRLPIQNLRDAFMQMQGTFIAQTNYGFSISPDILFEVLACKHASENPTHMLKYMNSKFISTHIHFYRLPEHCDPYLSVVLPRSFFLKVADRLYIDLQMKKFRDTFTSEIMRDREFQRFFANYLERINCVDIVEMFTNSLSEEDDYFDPSFSGYQDVNKVEIYRHALFINHELVEGQWIRSVKGINWVVGYGYSQILLTILKKSEEHCPSDRDIFGLNIKDKTRMLILACYSKNVSMVETILKYVDKACIDGDCDGRYTPLVAACQTGEEEIVKCLIREGADINRLSSSYYNIQKTPLIAAIEYNHLHLVKLLLSKQVDINECNFEMESTYEIACRNGSTNIAELLRENGADVQTSALVRAIKYFKINIIELLLKNKGLINKPDPSGRTPLHWAVHNKQIDIVKQLISNGAELTKDHRGFSPFHLACSINFSEAVDYLLESMGAGMEVDFQLLNTALLRELSASALHTIFTQAVLNKLIKVNNYEIVEFALKEKIDPNHSIDGELPLSVACFVGNLQIVKLLLANHADVNKCDEIHGYPLHAAVKNGNLQTVTELVKNGARVNVVFYGLSPLHIAAREGNYLTVRYLIENGSCSDINARDNENFTALYHAANNNNFHIARYLIKHGAHFKLSDFLGHLLYEMLKNDDLLKCLVEYGNIFHKAVEENRLDIIKVLVQNGTSLEVQDEYDCQTPIIHAAEKGNFEMIEYFLTKTVDINAVDNNGRNALFWAICNERHDILEILLSNGASTTCRDALQRTPLHWVAEKKCTFFVDTLIFHGANTGINSKDIEGKTPLHRACEGTCPHLVRKLVECGADIYIRDKYNYTPMNIAFIKKRKQILEYLYNLE